MIRERFVGTFRLFLARQILIKKLEIAFFGNIPRSEWLSLVLHLVVSFYGGDLSSDRGDMTKLGFAS